jgi:hypothetical protein
VVPAHTHSHTHSLTSPCSRNGGTTHDETGVEAEGRSRRVEIPPQSQRRDGANVAAGEETVVCSKKTIAPRCRGSRHSKRAPTGRPSCFFDRPDVKEPRQGGRQQRTRLRWSRCPRPRQKRRGMSDPAGKATTATDPDGETQSSQRDGGSSREGRNNVDPAGKAAAATDPTKARKGRATGRFQPGRGLRRTWQGMMTAPAPGEA